MRPTLRSVTVGWLLAGVALLGAGAAPLSAQSELSDWRIEQDRSAHSIDASGEVEIVNPWGTVNLRAGDGDDLVISSAGQRHRDDPREPEILVEEGPSGLEIEVRFGDRPEIEEQPEWRGRRVDIGVSVPESFAVSIRTGEGDIETRGLVGPADLETTSGDIKFKGPGVIHARTDSGSVFAQFHRSDWPDPVSIETRTGDIRTEFLEGASVAAEIETRGPITSDFSITIKRSAGSRLKHGVAAIGTGGQNLRMTSYNGAVRLVAVIVPEDSVE